MIPGPGLRTVGRLADLADRRVLVLGFARTGRAATRLLAGAGAHVVVVDDRPAAQAAAEVAALGAELVAAPGPDRLAELAASAALVVVSPGVAPTHPLFAAAAASPARVISEVELAGAVAEVPILAVTGTNGKTSVTSLAAAMLEASGRRAAAAGNIGLPLLEAVAEGAADVVVAEVSSFQLAGTDRFHPAVAAWINLAEDHLDWHGSLAAYVAAKARIFANQEPGDVAVANAEDPVTLDHAAASAARLVTFGGERGDYRVAGAELLAPAGSLGPVAALVRRMPHDLANALAAAAVAMEAGAPLEGCQAALWAWSPLAHRVAHVATVGGVAATVKPNGIEAVPSGFFTTTAQEPP